MASYLGRSRAMASDAIYIREKHASHVPPGLLKTEERFLPSLVRNRSGRHSAEGENPRAIELNNQTSQGNDKVCRWTCVQNFRLGNSSLWRKSLSECCRVNHRCEICLRRRSRNKRGSDGRVWRDPGAIALSTCEQRSSPTLVLTAGPVAAILHRRITALCRTAYGGHAMLAETTGAKNFERTVRAGAAQHRTPAPQCQRNQCPDKSDSRKVAQQNHLRYDLCPDRELDNEPLNRWPVTALTINSTSGSYSKSTKNLVYGHFYGSCLFLGVRGNCAGCDGISAICRVSRTMPRDVATGLSIAPKFSSEPDEEMSEALSSVRKARSTCPSTLNVQLAHLRTEASCRYFAVRGRARACSWCSPALAAAAAQRRPLRCRLCRPTQSRQAARVLFQARRQ